MWFVLEALAGMPHDALLEAGQRLAYDLTGPLPASSIDLMPVSPA